MSIEDLQDELDTLRPLVIKVGMLNASTFDDLGGKAAAENTLFLLENALRDAHRACVYLQGAFDV